MKPEEELIHGVLTTFLDDKFYESGSDRIARLQALIQHVVEKGKGAEFVAKLACVARNEFNLRSVSHLLVGELAKLHRGDDLVKRAIVKVSNRPDDLSEIASYVQLPLPKQVKRGIRNAILKFDRYVLAKYKMEGKELSLVDLFNLTHPKVKHATKEQKKAWKDLLEGKLKSEGTWETEISNAEGEEAKAEAWEDLVLSGKLGYMALLRNLNNLIKNDVSDKVIKAAVKQLTDPERVAKSKQIPFRFLTAYNVVKGNSKFRDAVSEGMDLAVGNVPKFKGNTLIAIDKSGSMSGDPLEKASIFAAVIKKSNPDADVVLFADTITEFDGSTRLPVVDLANEIVRHRLSGGTATPLVFMNANKKYDRIFILSDNESWQYNCDQEYKNYMRRTKATPYVYAMDIQGYGTTDLKGDRVFHLAGFSDKVLDFVGVLEKGENLVDYVESYEL